MSSPKVVEAVYENGVLRPTEPLDLPDHQRVEIRISVRNPVQLPPEINEMIALLRGPLPELSSAEMAEFSESDVD